MNFTSIPAAYLDAAANWQQQQQNHQHENSGSAASHQQLLPSVAAAAAQEAPAQPHGGSIRPGSMSDRARMANLPMPEAALKCPRCESTNTKFCYFNNYSLSQPRHFCKTCRRYWTRGGALRNVPVGGGCRRNKRTKGGGGGGSSKSPAASSDRQTGSTCSANSASSNSGATHNDHMVGLSPHMASLRFMAPLHHNQHQLTDFGGGDNNMGLNNYGLSYNSPIPGPMGDLSFQLGSSSGGGVGVGGLEQWRMMNNNMPQTVHQQFQFHPFLAGLEGINITSPQASSSLLYPFDQGNNNNNTNSEEVITTTTTTGSLLYGGGGLIMRPTVSNSGVMTQQQASVKMEDSNNIRELNLSNQFLGSNSVVQGSEQYNWTNTSDVAGAAGTCVANWTDVSGFSSSSTTSNRM